MRAAVDAKAFATALDNACRLLPKSSVPVLEGILVSFEHERCTLTGTDFTTWLTLRLPAQGDGFSFVFQSPRAAVKACRYFDGELSIELHDAKSEYPKVTLSSGRRSGQFNTFPAKDYPEPPKMGETVSFTANSTQLLKRIERVKYAVLESRNFSERATQTCVQFSGNDVFCLDGYRAACDTDEALCFPVPFLTWGKSLAHLKLMGDRETSVQVDDRHIWFSSDTMSLCCSKVGAETFNLPNAVPRVFTEEFYANPAEFLQELEYLKGFIQSKRTGCVRFCGGRMNLNDVPNHCGTEIRIEGRSELVIGFSLQFMEDALKQFRGESRVKVKFSSSVGPIIIEAEGRNDFAMVLPIRLRRDMAA